MKHRFAVLILALLAASCASTTLEKIKRDISQAREIVDAVDEVASKLPQCAAVSSAAATSPATALSASIAVKVRP